MSLRDMFVDIGFNVNDGRLRGVDNAVDRFRNNTIGARTSTNRFESSIARTGREMDRFKRKTKGAGEGVKSFGRKVLGIAAAYVGIRAVTGEIKDWTSAANVQIEAETKLSAVMKNTKGVTNAQIQGIKNYAGQLQGLGVIGDEVALSGVQQLATYQLQSKTLKTLMPGMEDLIAQQRGLNASSQDAVSIGNMLGKVMSGQVGALSRAGINFTKAQEKILKYGTEEEKAATLADVLKMNVGGVNKALRETDAGKVKSATNAFGDMEEELGKKVLPLYGKFAAWFETKIPGIQRTLTGFLDIGIEKFDRLTFFVDEKALPAFKDLSDFFKSDVNPRFIEIGGLIKEIAVDFIPSLTTSTDDLKSELGTLITNGLDLVITTLTWIKDNSATVERTIYGLAGAWAVQRGILLFLNGVQIVHNGLAIAGAIASGAETVAIYGLIAAEKIQAGWTYTVTAAQWAWNAAMTANPVGLVVAGIAALGTGLVILYKRSETARNFMNMLWDGLKSGAGTAVNGVLGYFNKFIRGANEVIKALNKIPKVEIPEIPELKVSFGEKEKELSAVRNNKTIPAYASGTSYHSGGLALVGEIGPELVNLPRGSSVYSNSKSMDIIRKAFSGNRKAQKSIVDSSTTNNTKKASSININYAPVFNLVGSDDKTLLDKVEKKSKEVFERLIKENFHAVALEVD